MSRSPNFEGLPLDTPLSIAELAAHCRWPHLKMRRWLLRLNRYVIEQFEATKDAVTWCPGGILMHNGRHYYLKSVLDLRRAGLQNFGKRTLSAKSADEVTKELNATRRELRIAQGRIRDLERYAGLSTLTFQRMAREQLLRANDQSGAIPTLVKTPLPFDEEEDEAQQQKSAMDEEMGEDTG